MIDPESIDISDENSRLDTEWSVVMALREITGIALKGETLPTYAQALALAQQLVPKLFNRDESLLVRQQENDITREYRQLAKAESELQKKNVTPLELVKTDISKYENWINISAEFITYEELEKLYSEMKILDSEERIVIHAQEFGRNLVNQSRIFDDDL